MTQFKCKIKSFRDTFGNFNHLDYLDSINLPDSEKRHIGRFLGKICALCSSIDKIENRRFKIWCAGNMKRNMIETLDMNVWDKRIYSTIRNFIVTKHKQLIK